MASSARIDELRKKFDENPRRYFAPLANEYRKAGDLEQAIFICQEYLPQQPGHMSGHIVYGQALFELGRHDEARTVFETALSLDPENLIALRHLGDIARSAGDTNTARVWYQRVLEADPRNEEIAQIMMSLLTPAGAAPAVAAQPSVSPPADATPRAETARAETPRAETPPPIPRVDHNAPTPLSTPTVPPPIPQPAPALAKPALAKKEEELLDLDALDIGGVPLSTLRASKPANTADVAAEVNESAIERSEELSFDMPSPESEPPKTETAAAPAIPVESSSNDNLLDGEFEADPFAIAATPNAPARGSGETSADEAAPEPPIELATDLNIGLPDDGTESATEAMTNAALAGLETFEAGVIASANEVEPVALDTGSFFDLPPTPEPAPEAASESAPEPSAAASEPEAAFVTETMADLYLQQGHLESALDIFRKLVEMRPDDAALQSRLDAVQQLVFGTAPSAPETEVSEVATPTAYGGPTIREFLAGLVSPAATPMESQPAVSSVPEAAMNAEPEPEVEPEPEPESELETPPVAETPSPTPEIRPTPSSTQTVSESLDVFFGGADANEPDSNAASTLAEAFAPDGPETEPLRGVPAHRASSELSLDHVFKGGGSQTPSGAGADNFSFDQFFSPEAAAPAEEGVERANDTPSAATDDIAQFNAWLNGLKKT